jgi:hypothetical protein
LFRTGDCPVNNLDDERRDLLAPARKPSAIRRDPDHSGSAKRARKVQPGCGRCPNRNIREKFPELLAPSHIAGSVSPRRALTGRRGAIAFNVAAK